MPWTIVTGSAVFFQRGYDRSIAPGNREVGKYFFKTEVCELVKPSSSSSVGYHEHFLPVSVAVMSLSRLLFVRFSVIMTCSQSFMEERE